MYIHRALEPIIRHYSEHFKVVVVTGPRQVGKTTMLRHLAEEELDAGGGANTGGQRADTGGQRANVTDANRHPGNRRSRAYVTLDNIAICQAARQDPELFLQRYRPPVLIDEIQKAPELLPCIKEAADASDENGAFWLTGSQPLHLMHAVSESLAGRAAIVEMLGLSNAELAGIPSEPFAPSAEYFMRRVSLAEKFDVEEAFSRIAKGSLPGMRALPDDIRAGGYESYIDTYIMRDIRDLAHVNDEMKFRRFVSACAALTSKPVVYADLARSADIDEKTAKSWLSLLVSTYLVKIVQPYANSLLKRLSKQPIMHFTDTGLAAYLAGWDNPRTLEIGAMNGQIFETYVFQEIYKSYVNAGRRPPLLYFRNNDKKEIDLLLEKNATLYPVEVKKTASPSRADTKNFPALEPVEKDVPPELASFRREIGTGSVVCMASDTFPVDRRTWAFPVWGI